LGEGLFSGRQIVQPLALAGLITVATYYTFAYFYGSGPARDGEPGLLQRILDCGLCLGMLCIFLAASLYAGLQAVGLRLEQHHLEVCVPEAPPHPPLYTLRCFVSGRRGGSEDGLGSAARRWSARARSSEAIATLSEHLLMLRDYQYQHNLAPLQFAIWVLPLLGFIGTVVGITQAIAGLDKVLATAGVATGGGLQEVLAGLRFAFDTTFVGLVLVIPTMLYTLPLRAKAQQLHLLYHELLLNRYFADDGTPTDASR
jgi:hypothetical protein